MFTLRQQHFDAFADGCRETFEDNMIRHLQARFPIRFDELGEEKVRRRIDRGIDNAARYEIDRPADVARFIRFMFTLGPKFDKARRTAWVRPILQDTTAGPGERLDRIREEARARRRQETDKR